MKILLQKKALQTEAIIQLPSSKSISNRVLMIHQLCNDDFHIKNLSTANDTKVLQDALLLSNSHIDLQDAGTATRFILPYLCNTPGEWTVTASARMQARPIAALLKTLRELGADIQCLEQVDQLPLLINGHKLAGGTVSVDASLSSQFVSALLLLAPTLPNGLNLIIENLASSKSYIDMTLEVMRYFGIQITEFENQISITPQSYKALPITIEADWSAASYYYLAAALIPNSRIQLNNLSVYSWQGDMVCSYLGSLLGAETHLLGNNIAVRASDSHTAYFDFDFKDNTDLVMTMAVWCCAKKIKASFKNIDIIAHKESDRLTALQQELKKFNCQFYKAEDAWLLEPNPQFEFKGIVEISTYNDHRMAMAFAPLSVLMDGIIIEDANVVNKSFPNFWEEWKKLGFEIVQI
jgi:3-phosphoshikimate 1-carboxyvinyltransferase